MKNLMRVAIDLRSLMETGGKISGVENYLLHVLDKLENDKGEYFGFYNRYKEVRLPKLKESIKMKFSRIPNKFFNVALTFLRLPKFEKLYGDFDILWLPDLRPFSIYKKSKLAVTVHDLSPVMYPQLYSLKRRIWHKLINYKESFKRADLIFAVSEYTKYDLIKIFGIDPKKIKVIMPGIDHDRFNPNLDERLKHKVKERYKLPEKFILSISTIEPRKNISALISAFEQIPDQETHLIIAGRLGWLYTDLLVKIDNSPKREKIKLIGYVLEEDKPYLISLSNVVCYPSHYEGFGFVPLEAMACGVPVITSARTSMPEICADAALLIEPNSLSDLSQALSQLSSDAALRENFISKGLERAKYFNWRKTSKEIDLNLRLLA